MTSKPRQAQPSADDQKKLTPVTDPSNLAMHDPEKDGDITKNSGWRKLAGLPPE